MKTGRMRFSRLAPLVGIVLLMPAPAHADSLGNVMQDIAEVLSQMEGNLITRDGIEMNTTDWVSHRNSIEERQRDYNGRVESHNSYCQGTFEEDEYDRRVAQCDSIESQLDTLLAQLQLEYDASDQQARDLQSRETERANAYQQLDAQLSALLPRLIGFCATMTTDEQQSLCRLPPAPGPRTQPIVDEVSTLLSGAFGR